MSDNYIIRTLSLQDDPHEVFAAAPDMDAYRRGGLNWGMSNPIYRQERKWECRDIMRVPLVIPTSVLRRGGDATLEWFRKESFDLGLRRESARAMLRYIERFETGDIDRSQYEKLGQAMRMAAEGMRAAARAMALKLAPAFERAGAQFREFAEEMEKALEEERQSRFDFPYSDGSRISAPSRYGLRGYGGRRLARPGRGRGRTRS